MQTNDWRSRIDFSSTTAKTPAGWFIRAMIPEMGRDGRALYSASSEGRVTDTNGFVAAAMALGDPLVVPLNGSSESSAGWINVNGIGNLDDEQHLVIGLENGLLSLFNIRGNWWMAQVLADSEELSRRTIETLGRLFVKESDKPDRDVRLLVYRNGELAAERGGDVSAPFEYDNYPANVAAAFDQVVEFLEDPEPSGRLTLLEGPPGTGKSYFLKGLMHSVTKCTFVYVPAVLIGSLTGPTLMQVILDLKEFSIGRSQSSESGECLKISHPVVLIMEDADYGIIKRAADNFSIISEIANLTSGIPGQLLDVRIIATTNAGRLDIDEAIMRPGRLAHLVEFPHLASMEAQHIYDRLTRREGPIRFEEATSLASIYQAARGETTHGRKGREGTSAGFGPR